MDSIQAGWVCTTDFNTVVGHGGSISRVGVRVSVKI